eukprot:s1683_g16.t1
MDFPSQFSDADFEGDSDDSDLGARHSPAPGPAQRQRFSDQLQRYVLWSALGDHIRRRGGADLRASTNRFRAIQSRQAQMPPQGIQREVVDLLSQDDQHLEIRLLNDTIGGLRRLFQSSLLENDQDWVAGTGGRYCPGKAPMLSKLRDLLEQELPLYVPGRYNDQCALIGRRGNVGHRLYAAFKANAHRADIFRYVDHYLRGGLYLDIKTALLEPLERIQERIVAEFKADASLIAHAANLYGRDPAALAPSRPPDYFMTAIGTRKDHIFQGILLDPLMLAALHHCFGPTLVDQQDLSGFRYMAFCEELFRVIKADRYQGTGTPLTAGWVLGFGLGPIYLLQETHEPALKTAQPNGLPNDCFRTAGGQMVALTRCWKWNKGWKGHAAGKQAQHDRNPVEFATDAGLQRRYLRRSGASENWHHASQAAYDQRAQQARASATGTGAAGAPNPKDESGTQAPPPAETSVPYERSKAPEPEPSRQRTIPELCSTKDFVEWVTAVADFQALVEPDVHGVLQAAEFGAVWRSRMETLAKTPTIVCDLPNVPLRDKKVSGKVVISEEGRLTIATTTTTRNQAGQVLWEEEQVLPRATLWVGGLHAFLQHAIRLSF